MNLQEVFEKLGIGTQTIHRLKLGHGVVGKLTTIAIITICILGALAFQLNNIYVTIGIVLLIFIFATLTFKRIMKIAYEHPDIALLEGAEFLIYHSKIGLGAKELPKPPKIAKLETVDPKTVDSSIEEKEEGGEK
jgi:hypothetical protein